MNHADVSVEKWLGTKTPSPSEIEARMRQEGLGFYRWCNGPGDVYGAHDHPYHKIIYVVSGDITFGLPDQGRQVHLEAGDRLDLPAGITHDAVVGKDGVVCLEAHTS